MEFQQRQSTGASRLAGRVCIVTGGASGIGLATCQRLAAEGAIVVVADKDGEAAGIAASSIGIAAMPVTTDVSSLLSVRGMVHAVMAQYNGVDVLVNHAGYGISGTILDTSEDQWDTVMSVNLKGVFLCSREIVPIMREHRNGNIINVALAVSMVGVANRAAYIASKGAIGALTRAMAADHIGDNIRVNAVAPGATETPYYEGLFKQPSQSEHPSQEHGARQLRSRTGRPIEITSAIAFLASDDATFMTGTLLPVDDRWTAR